MSSALLAVLLILSAAPADPPATLKGVLLEQLKTTHDQEGLVRLGQGGRRGR